MHLNNLSWFYCVFGLQFSHAILWSRAVGSYASSNLDSALAAFTNLPNSVCIFDEIELVLKDSFQDCNATDLLICVESVNANMSYLHHLPATQAVANIGVAFNTSAVIKCALQDGDGAECIPVTSSLGVMDHPGGRHSLVIRFAEETSVPELPDTESVLSALSFQPHITGEYVFVYFV